MVGGMRNVRSLYQRRHNAAEQAGSRRTESESKSRMRSRSTLEREEEQ
jgi:hypothetical protein